jgi:HEPN domain-containing protein
MGKPESNDWLRFARDDFETAEYLLGMNPRKVEIICYHCQQCAEKCLKAILAQFDDEIPRTHDLRSLLRLGLRHVPTIEALSEVLPGLQPYAAAVRYPYELAVTNGDELGALQKAR